MRPAAAAGSRSGSAMRSEPVSGSASAWGLGWRSALALPAEPAWESGVGSRRARSASWSTRASGLPPAPPSMARRRSTARARRSRALVDRLRRGPHPADREARTTPSATAPTTRIAAIAASRRCCAIDAAGSACRRRVVEPATRVTPDKRLVEPDDLARPAGRTPRASSLAADATNRDGTIGPGPTPPESPRGRRVRRRRAHIPSESSTIRGSRTRSASSRGTKRTAIATKPRTTSAPTIHSTGVDYPQRPVSPSRPVAILASDRGGAHPSDCVRTPPLRIGATRWSCPGTTCDASAQRVPAGAGS
jgi:hypothetical protein